MTYVTGMELTRELDIIIPASVSRRSTFKEKIEEKLGGIIQFYRPLHVELSDRHNYYSNKISISQNFSTCCKSR